MVIARVLVLVLLVPALLCFALYAITGNERFKKFGVRLVRWAVIALVIFFVGLGAIMLWQLLVLPT
ncbi:MAG: hypothetical protein ACO3UO_06145 [Burkholderiaceae bacterium]